MRQSDRCQKRWHILASILLVYICTQLIGCESHRPIRVPINVIANVNKLTALQHTINNDKVAIIVAKEICIGCTSGLVVDRFINIANDNRITMKIILVGAYSETDIKNFNRITNYNIPIAVADSTVTKWFNNIAIEAPFMVTIILKPNKTLAYTDVNDGLKAAFRWRQRSTE